MALPEGLETLLEAGMMHGDVRDRLSQAIQNAHAGSSSYAHYLDHSGDGKEGNCVFMKDGACMSCPYEAGSTGAKLAFDKAKKVNPKVTYHAAEAEVVEVTGDVIPLREGAVGQDGSAYLKLIAPGWGSSGYYSPELLERDGTRIFTKGTKNYWNHQTQAEEAARPEGDLRDLASVLTEDARYEKNGPAGPGLYARAKVFEQFRQPVDDLAKHIGVSIRATGRAQEGTADGRKGPIIQELTRAISADYVTQAGAGGQVLQLFEAARKRPETEGVETMTEAELREMRDLRADVKKMRERAAVSDAAGVIAGFFKTVRVGEAIEKRVTARLLERSVPLTASGDLDNDSLKKLWEAETKEEAEYVSSLSNGRIVVNMGGITEAAKLTPAEEIAQREAESRRLAEGAREYGFETQMGARIFNEGRSAFSVSYNAREDREKAAA